MKTIAVIPALNCEKTISKVVKSLNGLVDEVIVVDDGSIDQTKNNGYTHGATVVSHSQNKGLGEALKTGFKKALERNGDIIVTLDGDGQHEPRDVKRIMDLLIHNHCDVVIGSRLLNKAGWRNFPKHRLWGNLLLTFLTNSAIGKKVTTDSQSGYRAFKRKVIEKNNLKSSRMAIASEIIFETAKNNFKIKEVPIKATYEDEVSNQKIMIDPLRIIMMLTQKYLKKK